MTSDIPPPAGPGDAQQPPSSYPWNPTYPSNPGYGGGAVPGYPQGSGSLAPPAEPPPSVARAVMLMRLGAALSVVNLVVGLATLGSLRDNIKRQLVKSGDYNQSNLDGAYNAFVAFLVAATVIGVCLWLWMASANGKGRKWARVVATALGGLSILGFVLSLGQGQASTLSLLLSVVTALLAVVILVLLWRRESTDFYDARSRPAYT